MGWSLLRLLLALQTLLLLFPLFKAWPSVRAYYASDSLVATVAIGLHVRHSWLKVGPKVSGDCVADYDNLPVIWVAENKTLIILDAPASMATALYFYKTYNL